MLFADRQGSFRVLERRACSVRFPWTKVHAPGAAESPQGLRTHCGRLQKTTLFPSLAPNWRQAGLLWPWRSLRGFS